MCEALHWAGCLEEKLRPHSNPLLGAIRFARDSVVHQWADAVDGRDVPFAHVIIKSRGGPKPPAVVWDWFWRDRSQLPSTPRKFQHSYWKQNAGHYDTLLAGKPIRETLEALRGTF